MKGPLARSEPPADGAPPAAARPAATGLPQAAARSPAAALLPAHDPASADEACRRLVRLAARAVGRHGLAHAYGHCSLRLDAGHLLVGPPRPMGLVEPGDACTVVPVDGALPAGVLGEVRIHQQILRLRPDVGGIVRSMPPALMALGTARRVPRPRHGPGSYFHDGIALWDDPQLLRDDGAAARLARTLGARAAIVMRGNGVVVAAPSLPAAVVLTWYLEDAARLELQLCAAGLDGDSVVLDEAACRQRATMSGLIFERMWDYLTATDPELPSPPFEPHLQPRPAETA